MIKIDQFDRFDAGLRQGGLRVTSRLFKYGIGEAYDRKPFWLVGGLPGYAYIGHGGCPKVRNLGFGRDGGLVFNSQI